MQTHNVNTYNINEGITQTQNYLFFQEHINELLSEENKVPEHCLMLEKVAGSATYNQSKTAWNDVVL